jgi:hypothetical protein
MEIETLKAENGQLADELAKQQENILLRLASIESRLGLGSLTQK